MIVDYEKRRVGSESQVKYLFYVNVYHLETCESNRGRASGEFWGEFGGS